MNDLRFLAIRSTLCFWSAVPAFISYFLLRALHNTFEIRITAQKFLLWQPRLTINISTVITGVGVTIFVIFFGATIGKALLYVKSCAPQPKPEVDEVQAMLSTVNANQFLEQLKPQQAQEPAIDYERMFWEWMLFRLMPMAFAMVCVTGGLL